MALDRTTGDMLVCVHVRVLFFRECWEIPLVKYVNSLRKFSSRSAPRIVDNMCKLVEDPAEVRRAGPGKGGPTLLASPSKKKKKAHDFDAMDIGEITAVEIFSLKTIELI